MIKFKGSKLLFLKYLVPIFTGYVLIYSVVYLFSQTEFLNKSSYVINFKFTYLIIIFLAISLFFSFLYTLNVHFNFTSKKLNIVYGTFFKVNKNINISDIKSISYRKSLLDILLKRTMIQFEVVAITSNRYKDLNIYLKNKEIIFLKQFLLQECKISEELFADSICGNEIIFNTNELFLKSLSQVIKIYALSFFLLLIFTFVNSFKANFTIKNSLAWFLIFATGFLLLYLITLCYNIVKFNGFKINYSDEKITFTYGLFVKREYTIVKKDINAIIVKQRVLDRTLKKITIKIDCLGIKLNTEKRIKQSYLIPYCDLDFLYVLKKKLNLDLIYDPINMYKPTRFTFTNFVILFPILKTFIVYCFFFLIGINDFLMIYTTISLLLIYYIFEGFDKLSNQNIYFNDKIIVLDTGAITKYRYFINTDSIQKLERRQSLLKKLQKVNTIAIHYKSNYYFFAQCVNLDCEVYDKLLTILKNK